MAGAIQYPPQWCKSKVGPDLKQKIPEESWWIDGCINPSGVAEELRSRELAAPVGELCKKSNKGTAHDEGAAFVALLRACTKNKDLHRGTIIHDDILKKGLFKKCSDALVIMYAKCGALAKAQALLDRHKSKNVVPWTALIAGYARDRQSQDALECFERMQHKGIPPNAVTYSCVLKACGTIGAADKGRQIHDEIARQGLLQDNTVLGNALVDMYGKCGALGKAKCVLEELPSRNVVSWNALITAYAVHGQGEQALDCFERMQQEGISPDAVTFACILKSCGAVGAVDKGKQIHEVIAREGLLRDNIVLVTALVDMYAKFGALGKAERVLEEFPSWDVVSWNALITGYAQHGQGEQAIDCFERMQHEGIPPNAVTYTCILKACGVIRAADKGKQIHDEIVRQGLLRDNVMLGTALVDMYGKCGSLREAEHALEELPSRNVVTWNALIAGYAQHDQGQQALDCYERMQHEGIPPNAVTYACILKACGAVGAADRGGKIHDEIVQQGLLQDNIVLGNALVDMYARCGALGKAVCMLQELPLRDVVSWNALIAGHVQHNKCEQALNFFERMQHEGISPNSVTYATVLRACGTLGTAGKGKLIHGEIVRQGLLRDNIVLGTALVDMYGKCGALGDAERVLEELPSRNVTSWNALIAGYAQHDQGEQALDCFERMQHEGIPPDVVTYAWSLKACGIVGATDKGKQLHDEIAGQGLLQDNIVLGTALVDMYAKCGALGSAERVLEELPSRDVVSWSTLITGYMQQGQGDQALDSFMRMQHEGVPPNAVTYACVLKACGTIGAAYKGKQIHDEIDRQGLLRDHIVLGNALVDMYGKCGALGKAECMLEELPSRNVVSWNALITAYAVHDQGEQALDCFERMQHEGVSPDAVTFACILKACGAVEAVAKGKQIHKEIARQGLLQDNIVLGTALVDMYAKFGALGKAECVFEELFALDVVSWNALIAGYAQHNQGEQALDCFERMQQEGFSPDAVTYACILKACGAVGAADKGKRIHAEIARQGLLQDNIVVGNALVDMYGKCGALGRAECVLQELPSRNIVSWNALITAYAQYGQDEQALHCFERMQHEGVPPDVVTYAYILTACGTVGAVDKGKQVHDKIVKQGLLQDNIVLGDALVDMYGKCGALSKAECVLEGLPSQSVVSWNALIAAYVQHGQGKQVLDCLERMQHKGIPPNVGTLCCVLNVCSHLGLVEEGQMLFINMSTEFGVKPDIKSYTCMIDLFGRAGHLERAVRLIRNMPSSDYSEIWHALLGACQKWGDANVGRWAFDQAVNVDEKDGASYVLMANISAAACMQGNGRKH